MNKIPLIKNGRDLNISFTMIKNDLKCQYDICLQVGSKAVILPLEISRHKKVTKDWLEWWIEKTFIKAFKACWRQTEDFSELHEIFKDALHDSKED